MIRLFVLLLAMVGATLIGLLIGLLVWAVLTAPDHLWIEWVMR